PRSMGETRPWSRCPSFAAIAFSRPASPPPDRGLAPAAMPATLVFDIETVPDVAGYRALFALDAGLADAEVAELAFQRRRAASGHDFLPLHLQRVIAVACVLRERDSPRTWSLGTPAA